MKTKLLVAIIVFFWNKGFSQGGNLFQDILIDSSTVLVGMYPHYDLERTYQKYNFYISDIKVIDSLKNTLMYGDKLEMNWFETNSIGIDNAFRIKLIQNESVVAERMISPKHSNVELKDGMYFFDPSILKLLSSKYHFKYKYYKKSFKDESEYMIFQSNLIKDKDLIYINKPNFNIEGKFDVQFIRSEIFSSPKTVCEYIESKFPRDSTEKYYMYYIANDYNLRNPNQFTITIESSMQFYTYFKIDESKKRKWKPEKYMAIIFLKK